MGRIVQSRVLLGVFACVASAIGACSSFSDSGTDTNPDAGAPPASTTPPTSDAATPTSDAGGPVVDAGPGCTSVLSIPFTDTKAPDGWTQESNGNTNTHLAFGPDGFAAGVTQSFSGNGLNADVQSPALSNFPSTSQSGSLTFDASYAFNEGVDFGCTLTLIDGNNKLEFNFTTTNGPLGIFVGDPSGSTPVIHDTLAPPLDPSKLSTFGIAFQLETLNKAPAIKVVTSTTAGPITYEKPTPFHFFSSAMVSCGIFNAGNKNTQSLTIRNLALSVCP